MSAATLVTDPGGIAKRTRNQYRDPKSDISYAWEFGYYLVLL